jgi:hypothetical protein
MEAVTREPRNEMLARISEAFRTAQSCVIDFRFFSNLALLIKAEVSSAMLADLRRSLSATGLRFSEQSVAAMDRFCEKAEASASPQGDCLCHLFVTFIHGEPDMRIEIPAIPG